MASLPDSSEALPSHRWVAQANAESAKQEPENLVARARIRFPAFFSFGEPMDVQTLLHQALSLMMGLFQKTGVASMNRPSFSTGLLRKISVPSCFQCNCDLGVCRLDRLGLTSAVLGHSWAEGNRSPQGVSCLEILLGLGRCRASNESATSPAPARVLTPSDHQARLHHT